MQTQRVQKPHAPHRHTPDARIGRLATPLALSQPVVRVNNAHSSALAACFAPTCPIIATLTNW
jgi:hypothetical protein